MNTDKVNRYLVLNNYMLLTMKKIYNDIRDYFTFDSELILSFINFTERLNNDFTLIKNKYNNQYETLNKLVIGNTYIYDNGYYYNDAIFLGCIHLESEDYCKCANICYFGLKSKVMNDYCAIQLNKLYLIKDKYEH